MFNRLTPTRLLKLHLRNHVKQRLAWFEHPANTPHPAFGTQWVHQGVEHFSNWVVYQVDGAIMVSCYVWRQNTISWQMVGNYEWEYSATAHNVRVCQKFTEELNYQWEKFVQ